MKRCFLPVFSLMAAVVLFLSCEQASGVEDYSEVYTAQILERPDDQFAEANSYMGRSISVHQNRALVGCPTGAAYGGAFVYELDSSGIWKQVATLKPAGLNARDEAGTTVAIHGDLALVGVPKRTSRQGAAYVYARQGDGSWLQEARLQPTDLAERDFYGTSVAVYGDRIAVGASDRDHEGKIDSGCVYVYKRVSAWEHEATLFDSDAYWYQGRSLSMADGIIVSAIRDADAIPPGGTESVQCGLVRVYAYSGTAWELRDTLVPAGGKDYDRFGMKTSIEGGRIAVISNGYDDSSVDCRSFYIFEKDGGGSWVQSANIPLNMITSDGDSSDICISGDRIAIANENALVQSIKTGIAIVYELNADSQWQLKWMLYSPSPSDLSRFGQALAFYDSGILVSEMMNDQVAENAGAVYDFRW